MKQKAFIVTHFKEADPKLSKLVEEKDLEGLLIKTEKQYPDAVLNVVWACPPWKHALNGFTSNPKN